MICMGFDPMAAVVLLKKADVLGGYARFGAALQMLFTEEFADLTPDETWLVNTVGFEREDSLFSYMVWPIYFEHRVRRRKRRRL